MITPQQKATGARVDGILILLFPWIISMFLIYVGYSIYCSDGLLRLGFFATHLSGCILSLIAVARMFGLYRRFTNLFCGRENAKINCDSVIASPAGYIIGEVTWSDAGVLYFVCMLLLNLFPFSESGPFYLIGAFVSTPYILFSILYQGFVVRSWCPLCLAVQFALFLQFLLALQLAMSHPIVWDFSLIIPIFLLFPVAICSYFSLKSLLKNTLSCKAFKQNFDRMKAEYIEFFISDKIDPPGHLVFNQNADNRITYVFRFGCPPCIYHLSKLLDMLEQNKFSLELVFTTQPQYLKQELPLMLYFTSLYRMRSKTAFLVELRNYVHTFPMTRKKYASCWQEKNMNSEIKNIVTECICWCKEHNIQITPTYLLNGRIINPFYKFDDLLDRICPETVLSSPDDLNH